MGNFSKDKPCQSVKIWSKSCMDDDMLNFGWHVFQKFNRDIQNGTVGSSRCVYSGSGYAAYTTKTKGGCASICVERISE